MFIRNGINFQTQARVQFDIAAPNYRTQPRAQDYDGALLRFGGGYQEQMKTSTVLSQGWNAFLTGSLQLGRAAQQPYASPSNARPHRPVPQGFGQRNQLTQMLQMMQSLMAMLSQRPRSEAPKASYSGAQKPYPYQQNYNQPVAEHKPYYPKPVAKKPKPVAEKPQPVVEKPAPVAKNPEPVVKGAPQAEPMSEFETIRMLGGGTPVVLDLNNDGKFDTTGEDGKKVKFDLFGDGTKLETEWLKKGTRDGLLVADFNGDGKIDSGRELMRNTGVNGEQHKYATGWEKVRDLFDGNQDGKVSGEELKNLQVWVDSNGDGKTDPGELQSVVAHGVSEIDIPPSGEMVSSFVKDGNTQLAEDILFDYNLL